MQYYDDLNRIDDSVQILHDTIQVVRVSNFRYGL